MWSYVKQKASKATHENTDGNSATLPDATWLPLVTGNHPEYPSGHACFTAAVPASLRNYFGTKHVPIAISSTVVGTTRIYESLDEIVADFEDARVWGGLHYRTTTTMTTMTTAIAVSMMGAVKGPGVKLLGIGRVWLATECAG